MACIVAVLNLDGTPVEDSLLRALLHVPPYQRPADTQLRMTGGVGLGCVPLRPDAREAATHQPFSSLDGLSVVLDGRLDDRSSLRKTLESLTDRDLRSASDVELLARAYDAWGEDCVTRIIGDFAFCLWDERRQLFFGARDHLGVKPFFYSLIGNTLVVSNALRSVGRHPAVSSQLRNEAVVDFLLFGFAQDHAATLFSDISRLPPAHSLTCELRKGSPRVRRYWVLEPGSEVRYADPREYVEHFAQELKTAVDDRLREAKAGILMSGGLDSSSVAAIAAETLGPTGLHAYTAVYDRIIEDRERRYSTMVADWLGISIEHLAVDSYELFGRWESDALPPEPSTEPLSAIMTDLLDRASSHTGVVLTGDGGDPLLLPSTVMSQALRGPRSNLVPDLWQCIGRARVRPPFGLRAGLREWLKPDPAGVPKWLADPLLEEVDVRARWDEFQKPSSSASARRDAVSGVLTPYWASTFEGQDPAVTQRTVEVRHPFFDVRLASYALRLPSFPWCVNKTILRSAMEGRLPEAILTRPKTPLAGDPLATRRRWSLPDVMKVFSEAPGIDRFVNRSKFQSLVRPEHLLTDDEPGTMAALSLASWLRCSVGARICV